jgi:hypothetical protein
MAAMIVSGLIEDGVVVTPTTTAAAKDDSTFIYDKEKMIWDALRNSRTNENLRSLFLGRMVGEQV